MSVRNLEPLCPGLLVCMHVSIPLRPERSHANPLEDGRDTFLPVLDVLRRVGITVDQQAGLVESRYVRVRSCVHGSFQLVRGSVQWEVNICGGG